MVYSSVQQGMRTKLFSALDQHDSIEPGSLNDKLLPSLLILHYS